MTITIFDINKLSSFLKEVHLEKLLSFPATRIFKSSDKENIIHPSPKSLFFYSKKSWIKEKRDCFTF